MFFTMPANVMYTCFPAYITMYRFLVWIKLYKQTHIIYKATYIYKATPMPVFCISCNCAPAGHWSPRNCVAANYGPSAEGKKSVKSMGYNSPGRNPPANGNALPQAELLNTLKSMALEWHHSIQESLVSDLKSKVKQLIAIRYM